MNPLINVHPGEATLSKIERERERGVEHVCSSNDFFLEETVLLCLNMNTQST